MPQGSNCNTNSLYVEWHYAEYYYVECRFTRCHYAKCRYSDCHYEECHRAECRSALARAIERQKTEFNNLLVLIILLETKFELQFAVSNGP